jgi:hypothetical protein
MHQFPCFRGFSTFHALAAAAVSFYLLLLSNLFSEDARGAIIVDRKSWLSDGMFGVSLLSYSAPKIHLGYFQDGKKMQDQGMSQNILFRHVCY